MADRTIQSLPAADALAGTELFVLQQNGAKNIQAQDFVSYLATALNGHGGISSVSYTAPEPPSLDGTLTITMVDDSSYSLSVANGRGISNITWTTSGTAGDGMTHTGTIEYNDGTTSTIAFQDGVKGDQGQRTYVWVAWADDYPTSDSQVKFTAGPYIGFYSGTASTAPTAYTAYTWYEYKGDRGDTGDYIEPILSYGNSAAAGTEPVTWYSNPTSISYSAGNFIWRKTEYVLHEIQTVQATKTEIIGYIGQNGSGSGTVTHITFNGTAFQDDGTGNVSMTVDADDVGAIANPINKANGQVLTYDSVAGEWVAATPSTGSVNTVNNVGPTAGTTNVQLYATAIPMSSTDNTSVASAIPSASNALPNSLGTASAGSGAGFSRYDHVHPMPSASDVGAVSDSDVTYKIFNSVTDLGLTSGSATISGAYSALGANEMLICDSDDFSGTQTPSTGLVHITKGVSIARGSILFYGKTDAVGDYRMFLSGPSNTPDGVWHCLDNNGLLLKTTSTSGTATANTRLELTVSWGLPTGATVQAFWIQSVVGTSNTDAITRCDFTSSTKIRAMSTVGQKITVGVGCLYTKTFTVS